MGYRKQITEANPVGTWIRSYRKRFDMSMSELQKVFDDAGTLGVPIARIEITKSPITKVVSTPILEHFDYDSGLLDAFKLHNAKALSETYEVKYDKDK